MVQLYVFGHPFETDAVVQSVSETAGNPPIGTITTTHRFSFTHTLEAQDVVYGLGEANRGINKRGFRYVNHCSDTPSHTEDLSSLYAAHNFIVLSGTNHIGLFFDYPTTITFDIGYTQQDTLSVTCDSADLKLYVIQGDSAYDVVKEFRSLIGPSYIPPKFAFGFGQSRWGYKTRKDFERVVQEHRKHHIPLDMVYMDIDYMEDYKDFTVNSEEFPDFPAFVQEMREQGVHLVPIIDAGVKIEKGYPVYEEGVQKGYFCKREDGSDFEAAVWPGLTHFPDVLNPEVRQWFGNWYRVLVDAGIDGFWNDMNEPAIFYSPEGLVQVKTSMERYLADSTGALSHHSVLDALNRLSNSSEDYQRFYHKVQGEWVRHDRVHNLFGYNMTRAAGEALAQLAPDRRILLFSRSSYIGMHRYGGVWTGDNMSWWSHILLNIKMMPSLNMCGFLYCGADLGGFGCNTTRDLLLRWLAFGVFTPLMRNHSALGTREQEFYQFENPQDFRHIISVRYRLIPYLYSEFMKAALGNDLYFKPLSFLYPNDPLACEVEDQLMIGNEVMVAPVYQQNATGRYVYLPEEMLFVKFCPDGTLTQTVLPAGVHHVSVALNEVPLFIRQGHTIPLAQPCETVVALSTQPLECIGYSGATYTLYDDDGMCRSCTLEGHTTILTKE